MRSISFGSLVLVMGALAGTSGAAWGAAEDHAINIRAASCKDDVMTLKYDIDGKSGALTDRFSVHPTKDKPKGADACIAVARDLTGTFHGKIDSENALKELMADEAPYAPRFAENFAAALAALKEGRTPPHIFGSVERRALHVTIRQVDCDPPMGESPKVVYAKDADDTDSDSESIKINPKFGSGYCARLKRALTEGSVANLREDDGFLAAYQLIPDTTHASKKSTDSKSKPTEDAGDSSSPIGAGPGRGQSQTAEP